MGALTEMRELAEPDLVEDLAGLLVPEVVDLLALPGGEHPEGRLGQFGRERQRLVAGDDAVPAEQRHEPRKASRGH